MKEMSRERTIGKTTRVQARAAEVDVTAVTSPRATGYLRGPQGRGLLPESQVAFSLILSLGISLGRPPGTSEIGFHFQIK